MTKSAGGKNNILTVSFFRMKYSLQEHNNYESAKNNGFEVSAWKRFVRYAMPCRQQKKNALSAVKLCLMADL